MASQFSKVFWACCRRSRGADLGPNLSVTGSLATILWLSAIRREGQEVGFWQFFKVGAVVMPPALLLALGARLLFS